MNVCEWCGCVLFAGIRHARCETAVAMAAHRDPRRPDGTFWLGADAEPAAPPSRDLSDMTTSEAAIYRQAYAEGHAAARQGLARDWRATMAGVATNSHRGGPLARPAGHPRTIHRSTRGATDD